MSKKDTTSSRGRNQLSDVQKFVFWNLLRSMHGQLEQARATFADATKMLNDKLAESGADFALTPHNVKYAVTQTAVVPIWSGAMRESEEAVVAAPLATRVDEVVAAVRALEVRLLAGDQAPTRSPDLTTVDEAIESLRRAVAATAERQETHEAKCRKECEDIFALLQSEQAQLQRQVMGLQTQLSLVSSAFGGKAAPPT